MMHRLLKGLASIAALGALTLSAGCGFQPLYATQAYAGLPGMSIVAGQARQDYLIEDALRDFLGAGTSRYQLVLQTRTDERSLGLSAAGRASRFSYRLTTQYQLTTPDGEVLSGAIRETVFLDAPPDPYALLAARADAEERAAELIARRLASELASGLERQRRMPETAP